MKELTIQEIETIVKRDENRIMEAKQTTGELTAGMQSGCAFLNTVGGWLFFGIHPKKLTLLGQDVADQTRQEIANAFRKFSPAIDLSAQYVEVPDKPGKYVIAIHFKAPKAFDAPYTFDGRPWVQGREYHGPNAPRNVRRAHPPQQPGEIQLGENHAPRGHRQRHQ